MARRTWWKVGALLAAMMVFLTMLPATALAEGAAPNNLYVGDQDLPVGRDSYWTTSTDGKLITCEATNDWTVKYEPTSATLTLKNATIKGVFNAENIASAGIYAASSSGPVSLNIVLVGENEVTGGYGINVSSEGAASLSITGSGSLTVSATAANGIGLFVQAQSDANLTIDGANVNAVVTETNGRGVELRTGQDGNPNLTIEVKGGSLQASGQPNGIKFFTNANNTRANANLKVSGNAMVKTSGITTDADGSGSQGAVLTTEAGTGGTGGIVFDGSDGTVYGDVTLQEDLEIGEGESLTIPDGANLNTDGKLTVDGGTLTQNGTVTGDIIHKVTGVSLSTDILTLEEGGTANLTATITPANATNQNVTWSSNAPSVATVNSSGNVTAVAPGTATITVTTEDGTKTASCTVTVTVPVTGVTLSQSQARLYYNGTPNTFTLAATVAPGNATNKAVTWTSSNSAVATVDGNGTVTAVAPGTATITVTTADGSKTATCLVIVTGVYTPPRPTGPDWGDVADDIADAEPGSTVTVDMDGKAVLPGEVLDELAGLDVTLALDMGDGVSWEIYGGDVPESEGHDDVDLGVALGGDDIPADVANLVTGESGSVQVSLEHDGLFGFELTLVAPLGEDAAGLVANLYRYDDESGLLAYVSSAEIAEDGTARLETGTGGSWLFALDSRSHALPFSDAAEGEWYSEAVRWVWLSGLMTGYGDGSGAFGTEGALSRAQLATVLWRQAGEPEAASEASFADCDPEAFYAEAVVWADEAGIIEGYGDGSNFGPEDPVTREQLATILWRAAGEPEGKGDLSGYPDGDKATGYAVPALEWAVGEGVLSGFGDGSLAPGGVLSRAQLAAVLMRLAQEVA